MSLGKLEEVVAWSDSRGRIYKSKQDAIMYDLRDRLVTLGTFGYFLRENDLLKPQFRKEIIELLEMLGSEE